MAANNTDKPTFFDTMLNSGSQVLNEGVTINVAFDYVSTAYLALALFVGILFAMVAANFITKQIGYHV